MATAAKQARGTKRTCQNNECGSRFYDLNRDPIVCPICGGVYEIAHSPLGAAAAVVEEKVQRKPKRPEFTGSAEEPELAGAEGEEALEDVEGAEAIASDGDDETFLEEEEDGGDVSGIISGPVAEGEEES